MTATTIPAPRRITTLQWARAAFAIRIGLEPEHRGATADWHPLTELGRRPAVARGVVEIPTAIIPAVRRPVAAIAATPEYAVDELGPWRPEQHELEPARLFDALIGGAA